MRYYRARTEGGASLIAADDDACYELTAACPELVSFEDLCRATTAADVDIDDLAERWCSAETRLDDLPENLLRPAVPPEVWGTGVTYEISEEAREEESGGSGIYLDVYDAERPELFFKATPSRTVGPGDAIGVRADSDWDAPEPELALVVYRGDIVGYTIGNDVSSRDLEGENPLYLPQAKIYDRSCALGPCIASPASVGDPLDLAVGMEIERDGDLAFSGSTSTAKMVRDPSELVSDLQAHNRLPPLVVLLTGTSIVPPDDFTLTEGDLVRLRIESIGTLENPTIRV